MPPRDDREDQPIILFAVRLAGAEGWEFRKTPKDMVDGDTASRAAGGEIVTIREINQSSYPGDGMDQSLEITEFDYWQAIGIGWAFDYLAQCWRAPGDAVQAFGGTSSAVAGIDVEFGATNFGSLPIRLSGDGQAIELVANDMHSPFEDLIRWLENIADGDEARFTGEFKGGYGEFFAFPVAARDRMRICIALSDNPTPTGRRQVALDLIVPRTDFASSIYGTLRRYVGGPDYDPYQWMKIPVRTEFPRRHPNLPFERLLDFSAREVNELLAALAPDASGSGMKFDNPGCEVSDDYDGFDRQTRQACLDAILEESVTGGWGEDLLQLRSDKLEQLLLARG